MSVLIDKMNKNLQKSSVSLRKRKERMRKAMKKSLVQTKFESHARYHQIKKKNRVKYMNNLREGIALKRRLSHKRLQTIFFLQNIMKINNSNLEIQRYSESKNSLMIKFQ